MIKVDVTRANGSSETKFFASDELADAWLANGASLNQWGEDYTSEKTDLGNAIEMASIRAERNKRLADCDWTQLADSPLDSGKKAEWVTYRQALRDLPEQEGLDVSNPTWPTEPA